MARVSAALRDKLATPTLEVFKGLYSATTAVGTTAIEVPATPLTGRKAIIIQNIDSAKDVYIGGSIPDIYVGSPLSATGTMKYVYWKKAAAGTNEWYAVSSTGGTPGLTQPVRLYYATVGGGTETLGTSDDAKGSLSTEHEWAWGTEPLAAAFSTIFIRTDGGVDANRPDKKYDLLLGYTRVPDSSANYGYKLGPNDAVSLTLDGGCRIFAIASAASANVVSLELL